MIIQYGIRIISMIIISIMGLNIAFAHSAKAKRGMVVSASSLASKVGLSILKKGGNAIDAAVATGFALAVTYPGAGNIGGGGFLIAQLKNGQSIAIDFREKAPKKSTKGMFLDARGNVMNDKIREGALASGVPGSVAGLLDVLSAYGTMSVKEVLAPAIALAEEGFILDASMIKQFNKDMSLFKKFPSTMKVMTNNGNPYTVGDRWKQPDLAKTLRLIAEKGKDGFYKGTIPALVAKAMSKHGGIISEEDFAEYKAIKRQVVNGSYRGYDVISMCPPSSGGIALLQMLNILSKYTFNKDEWHSPRHAHAMLSAMKFAFADRTVHLGDPDFTQIPYALLLSQQYADRLASRIPKDKAIPSTMITAGDPKSFMKESNETTHYSVLDSSGNAVSVTTTINSWFGSGFIAEGTGFFLNNEMDDFAAKPNTPNQFGVMGGDANAIQPGKRMLSSMTPTIVLREGKPRLIIGAPGGSTIITTVLHILTNCLDFGMPISKAVQAPRFHHQWMPDNIDYEEGAFSAGTMKTLQNMGYAFGKKRVIGIAECIAVNPWEGLILGASDTRHHSNGTAEGW
ncbi:MAG: gamma-glutamyltransferase [Ignavibacteria bacterium]|nr:gamma-glutamyltransferase [Ignavibacteria bacterium]